ncbi:hypothetical protein R5R35_013523 [Gryllus longicercus]|uniref:N-acetyltransferase domain-containing protein n=1 Tax=Gryllus longicercus TaxID=2509291 RepID=A0AAN9VB95_9ORTH|nr:Putative N-acetyltransferase CML3 [Gryllus bimaculatus]
MSGFIVIRDYKPGDERNCQEVIRESTMSTVNTAFFSGLTREITFQVIILTSALMFIFLGVPFNICFGSIPVVIALMYVCVWLSHVFKAVQLNVDMGSIPRMYMSSEYTGFWVAEVYEKLMDIRNPQSLQFTIINSDESQKMDLSAYRKRIVGTIAVTRSHNNEDTAWIRRMGVVKSYQRKGIASALVDEVLRFCRDKCYQYVELVTTECHDAARELFLNKGFELKQMYHKQIVGSIITVQMFELMYKLKVAESP